MDVNVTVSVPPLEKLIDYTASGIGSVAHSILTPFLSPWQAKQQAQADAIAAEGQARTLLIQADAQATAQKMLISEDADVTGVRRSYFVGQSEGKVKVDSCWF